MEEGGGPGRPGDVPGGNAARAATALRLGYRVRAMEVVDVAQVARLHVEVWRQAYIGLMREEYLRSLDVARFEERWNARFEGVGRAEAIHLVGVHGERGLVAFGSAGPSRDVDPSVDWELYAINVLASEHGSGLADLLMAGLVAKRPASLWVLEDNRRARVFYARYGFAPDGASKTRPEIGRVEVRLTRQGQPAD